MMTNKRGSILIMALWILGLLTVLTVQIGLTIRGRISLLSRLESQSQLHSLTWSGVKKAISAVKADVNISKNQFTAQNKWYRHNNPNVFSNIQFPGGSVNAVYPSPDGNRKSDFRFGVVDEESKLNINVASRDELTRLIGKVTSATNSEQEVMIDGILGWRASGDVNLSGFYSDDYYRNLKDPYTAKHSEFEVPQELLLVQGMKVYYYNELYPFITIYGDGVVNINTAPGPVLYALGLEDGDVQKVLSARRGFDGMEATIDDHIFQKTFDVASEIKNLIELSPEELSRIDQLNIHHKIKTQSDFYQIQVIAQLDLSKKSMKADCIYNSRDNWVDYYHEK